MLASICANPYQYLEYITRLNKKATDHLRGIHFAIIHNRSDKIKSYFLNGVPLKNPQKMADDLRHMYWVKIEGKQHGPQLYYDGFHENLRGIDQL